MSNFVFKRGDTFNLNLQLVDLDETLQFPPDDVRRAIDLKNFVFSSQIKSLADGTAVAALTCAALNQANQKGWLNVKSSASTALWPLGLCQMDIKGVVGSVTQHSETLTFQVIEGVTT